MKPLLKRTAWKQWFDNLEAGERVIAIQPWSDRESIAVVGRLNKTYTELKTIRFRNRIGNRISATIRNPWGDCYLHVIPLGYKLVYWPSYGYVVKKIK